MALLASCGAGKEVAVEDKSAATDNVLKAYQGGEVVTPDSEAYGLTVKASAGLVLTSNANSVSADATVDAKAALVKDKEGAYQFGASADIGATFGLKTTVDVPNGDSLSQMSIDTNGTASVNAQLEVSDKTYMMSKVASKVNNPSESSSSSSEDDSYAYATQKMADYLNAAQITDLAKAKLPKAQISSDDIQSLEKELTDLQTNGYIDYSITQNSNTNYFTFNFAATADGLKKISGVNLVDVVNKEIAALTAAGISNSYLETAESMLSSYYSFIVTIPDTAYLKASVVLTDKYFPVSVNFSADFTGTTIEVVEGVKNSSSTVTPGEKSNATIKKLNISFDAELSFSGVQAITISDDDKKTILSKGTDETASIAKSLLKASTTVIG
jgi:hypothetical protein